MANIELLDLALKNIDNETFLWRQSAWIVPPGVDVMPEGGDAAWDQFRSALVPPCGTAMCLAGHIAWEAGYRPDGSESLWTPLDGSRGEYVSTLAARLLDISPSMATELFHPCNDRDDLQAIRDALAAGDVS